MGAAAKTLKQAMHFSGSCTKFHVLLGTKEENEEKKELFGRCKLAQLLSFENRQ